MNEVSVMAPFSAITLATSPMRRMFSARCSALQKAPGRSKGRSVGWGGVPRGQGAREALAASLRKEKAGAGVARGAHLKPRSLLSPWRMLSPSSRMV